MKGLSLDLQQVAENLQNLREIHDAAEVNRSIDANSLPTLWP